MSPGPEPAGSPLPLHRGHVYRVRLNPAEGSEQQGEARPCLIVHREAFRRGTTALVVPLTTQLSHQGFSLSASLPR